MAIAHVIGLGRSGVAAARLLMQQGWQVVLSDRTDSEGLRAQQQALAAEGITVKLGHSFDPMSDDLTGDAAGSDRPALVVVSPGVPWDAPGPTRARELGIETIGEVELAWRSLSTYPWVGITGTNGKTTTTALTAAIFQAAGLNAPACGNIGHAVCELALQATQGMTPPLDWVIGELSSYQIEASDTLAPRIGVWTTFTPDHLSRHKTLERYYEIKAKLLDQAEFQVINGDDPHLRRTAGDRWPQACWTSVQGRDALVANPERGAYLQDGWVYVQDEAIVQADTLAMVGAHNQQNLLMAVLAARLAGIEKAAIQQAIAAFPGVAHRLELIRTWQGVRFINDSKATNYDAAEVGLQAVPAPVILIAGGEAKEGDDTGWLRAIQDKAVAVLLIGDAAPAFRDRLGQVGYTAAEIVETMDRAVERGAELAIAAGVPHVLLSPACASFDQYTSFEHRGDHFRQLCLALAE